MTQRLNSLLAPDLDVDGLAQVFAQRGRLQINHALPASTAQSLYACLHEQVPWSLAYRDESGPKKLWAEELAELNQTQLQALQSSVNECAQQQFSFLYNSYMMITAYKEKRDPGLLLHRVVELINMSPWLHVMRRITGMPQIRRTDAQATRYIGGHFLKQHDDIHQEQGRLAAYVINLTPHWEAHWGGLLQFLDGNGGVEQTFAPIFNSISLFRVPAEHCVSPVGAFVNTARYAITGWLRT